MLPTGIDMLSSANSREIQEKVLHLFLLTSLGFVEYRHGLV